MLKGFQRKYLRSQGHHLDPVVMIGKNGLNEAVLEKINNSLESHELIKIRFLEYERSEKKTMCGKIESVTESECVGQIGHVALFFREHPDADERKYDLPQD